VVHLIKLLSGSAGETMEIGKKIGRYLEAGDAVGLTGVLGSGKSVLARGILKALGVEGEIPSPSFIIVASYEGRLPVNHVDLYRLRSAGEAVDIGIEDLLNSGEINVIEWAEKIGDIMPPARIDIDIGVRDEPSQRLITIRPSDARTQARLLPLVAELVRLDMP
jgi:tRNA threonylcarbamoyladenosine biosynthesis protein TsaE